MASRSLRSRVIRWLKVLLPLAAVAILSMLFLVARTINPDDAIPYAKVDVADRAREPRVTLPVWSGVTDDGSSLRITAAEARPGIAGTENAATATDVKGRLDMPGGRNADMVSDTARMDDTQGKMVFTGNVNVVTSDGYRAKMPQLLAAMRTTDLQSAGGEVNVNGPLGDITADQMHLTQGEGGYLLVFNGNVRLIYLPPK